MTQNGCEILVEEVFEADSGDSCMYSSVCSSFWIDFQTRHHKTGLSSWCTVDHLRLGHDQDSAYELDSQNSGFDLFHIRILD
jgi:hypothetical protein